MISINEELPEVFSFRSAVFGHGWVDLQPFRYDPVKNLLNYSCQLSAGLETNLTIGYEPDHTLSVMYTQGSADEIRTIVRRVFRLKEVFSGLYHLTDKSKRLNWIKEKSAGRMLCCGSLWEDLVKMICTTNCNWAMTKIMVTNLIGQLSGNGVFPSPEMVAGCTETFLREKVRLGYRAPYVLNLARDITEGKADLTAIENWSGDDISLYKHLLSIKGIGPYAAGSLMKLIGRYRHPAPDSWSRKKFMQIYNLNEPPTDNDIEKKYNKYGKWAGLIFWLEVTREWYFIAPVTE